MNAQLREGRLFAAPASSFQNASGPPARGIERARQVLAFSNFPNRMGLGEMWGGCEIVSSVSQRLIGRFEDENPAHRLPIFPMCSVPHNLPLPL